MEDKRVTEIYCHECDGYIRVVLDYSLNGNHEIRCPKCDHIHWRVIKDGEITSDRYKSSSGMIILSATTSDNYYLASSESTTSANNIFFAQSWLNTTI